MAKISHKEKLKDLGEQNKMLNITIKEKISIGKNIYPPGVYPEKQITKDLLLEALTDAFQGAKQLEVRGSQQQIISLVKYQVAQILQEIDALSEGKASEKAYLVALSLMWERILKAGDKMTLCSKCNVLLIGPIAIKRHEKDIHKNFVSYPAAAEGGFALEEQRFTALNL